MLKTWHMRPDSVRVAFCIGCRTFADLLLNGCSVVAGSLQSYCRIVAELLQSCCRVVAELLLKHCGTVLASCLNPDRICIKPKRKPYFI
jgi:hypothetical protein